MKRRDSRSVCRFVVLAAALLATVGTSAAAQRVQPAASITTTETRGELTVAAVQFEVTEARFRSIEAVRDELETLVRRAARRYQADVVVFPEYINVFLLAAHHPDAVAGADDLYAALASLGGATPASALTAQAGWTAARAGAIWSSLADRYDVVVVAGTLFAPAGTSWASGSEPGSSRSASSSLPRDDGLRNTLLVYGPDGELVYTQDKVYLTPIEAGILGVEPGRLARVAPIVVDGVEIGFTICRDTFFDAFEQRLAGVDLWIDLRANGEPYSEEVYRRFLGTLPERVAMTDASAGLNASLTGEFLGHVWAGPSYAVAGDGSRIAASDTPVGTQITAVRLTRRGGQWIPAPLSGAAGGGPTSQR